MKRVLTMTCAVAMALSLAACSTANSTDNNLTSDTVQETVDSALVSNTAYAGTTVVGQIIAVNDASVTLQLGELFVSNDSNQNHQTPPDQNGSQNQSRDSQTPPEKPEGEASNGNKPDDNEPQGEAPDGNGPQSQNGDNQTPPEKPEGEAPDGNGSQGQSGDNQTPPEKPEGEAPDGNKLDGNAPQGEAPDGNAPQNQNEDNQASPEKPEGEAPQGEALNGNGSESQSGDNQTPPEMPGGGMQNFTAGDTTITVDLSDATITKDNNTITVDDLSEGDILQVTFDENGVITEVSTVSQFGGQGGPGGGSFGGSGEVTQGASANTITEDGTYENQTYESTGDDENALRVDGAEVTLNNITVNKSAGATSNTENGDFYGVNAALLATDGANVTIQNATVTSSAQNGNGVFSYGSGTVVNIADSAITTTADNSGGIQTTGGGTTNASNLTVETSGNSSAAIRSDRGGGTVNVNGGTYTSNGYNSPAVYSTAAITVSDAILTANNSEALVIEGKNSISLDNCTVYGNMSDTKGTSSDENIHNVMIYQSMSGDADVGTSTFSMTGGSLTSNNGDLFYITNTACEIDLSGVQLTNHDSDSYLMNICGNSASHGWGTAGANGAQVVFTADQQELNGDIVVDTISTLTMTLKGNSTFTGTINIVDNAQNGTAVSDNAVLTIEAGSTWNLTGDCIISSLTNDGTINFNGYTITLADGTLLS